MSVELKKETQELMQDPKDQMQDPKDQVQEPTVQVQEPTVQDQEEQIINSWDDLDCDISLLRGIYSYGFEKPSPIQQRAILPMKNKKDIIAQAQSGTGKTGCFTIGMLLAIDLNINKTQALCISPTRELSTQIKSVIDGIGGMMKGLKTQLLVGGTSTDEDIRNLQDKKQPHVVIGCPGRIYDMLRRKRLSSSDLKIMVLDEADEMLSYGFKEQIYTIFQYLPSEIQVALFSATMPTELFNLTEKFMRNPVVVRVKTEQLTLDGIKQYYIAVENDTQKYETLKDLFGFISMGHSIIYCNSVKRVEELYTMMAADNFPVCKMHSSMDNNERKTSYNEFKNGTKRVLISSNVTARGIDVQQVSTVINFDIPKCVHTYLHRIGRSGRWGRKGVGINFISRYDMNKIKEIEEHYKTQIDELPMSIIEGGGAQ
jgi:translation initiation factor 4A